MTINQFQLMASSVCVCFNSRFKCSHQGTAADKIDILFFQWRQWTLTSLTRPAVTGLAVRRSRGVLGSVLPRWLSSRVRSWSSLVIDLRTFTVQRTQKLGSCENAHSEGKQYKRGYGIFSWSNRVFHDLSTIQECHSYQIQFDYASQN